MISYFFSKEIDKSLDEEFIVSVFLFKSIDSFLSVLIWEYLLQKFGVIFIQNFLIIRTSFWKDCIEDFFVKIKKFLDFLFFFELVFDKFIFSPELFKLFWFWEGWKCWPSFSSFAWLKNCFETDVVLIKFMHFIFKLFDFLVLIDSPFSKTLNLVLKELFFS